MTFTPSISQIRGRAVVVLPENVGLAVAVEIAGGRHMPARPRVVQRTAGRQRRSVPSISQTARVAAVVLPENVGLAVAIEIGGSLSRASDGPGLESAGPAARMFVPSISQIAGVPPLFWPEDVGLAVAIEIGGSRSRATRAPELGTPGPSKPRLCRSSANCGRAVVVLPENVAVGVAIETDLADVLAGCHGDREPPGSDASRMTFRCC